ncbi:MAG: ATP-binding protein [Melioribacteraceae bacterium]|nr:ATP-binding protein [Melioribacteraceae bacterium]
MNTETKNIKKYFYALSFVLFVGIMLFIVTHQVSHLFLDNLDKQKKNERNRIEIGEVIFENINLIENNLYHLFVPKVELSQHQNYNGTKKYYQTIFNAIDVLENSGVLTVNSYFNLAGDDKFIKVFEYYRNDDSDFIELVELQLELVEIQKLESEALYLSNEKDRLFRNKNNLKGLEEVKRNILSLSERVEPSFKRIRESVNGAFSKGYINLQKIELEIEESKEYYGFMEWVFLISITLTTIILSLIIVRKINRINSQLLSAKQEIRIAFEELEATNALLTQEIAEKKIAEDALAMSEHRLVSMWNSIHSGVLLVRKDNFKIIECNPAANRMIKLPPESVLGKNLHHFISTDNSEQSPIEETELKDGLLSECYLQTSDGGMIPILKTAVPLEINGVEHYLISFTDITILKDAEKALLNSKEQAENADKLKSIFLAQMSHEIRTPINVMLSISSLLQMEVEERWNEEELSYFELINKSGNRITRTIDLLLNLSEIQAGTYEPSPEKLDLFADILCVLILDYKKRAEAKKISFVVNLNTQNPSIVADIYTVEQIFQQLLDNAILFTEKGEINLTIRRNRANKLIVEIKDTGVGIEKAYFNDLFIPFTQEEMGYTRRFDGNGIGLSLVKSYCDLNKAVIEVESEKGIGSTFRVIFN